MTRMLENQEIGIDIVKINRFRQKKILENLTSFSLERNF